MLFELCHWQVTERENGIWPYSKQQELSSQAPDGDKERALATAIAPTKGVKLLRSIKREGGEWARK